MTKEEFEAMKAELDAISEQSTQEISPADIIRTYQVSTSHSISESEMAVMLGAAKMAVARVSASRSARLSTIAY